MDDAESSWEILESDAAASVLTTADQTEVEITVDKLKSQRSMSTQCQDRIFNKVKGLRDKQKQKPGLSGSQVPFPPLSVDMPIENVLMLLPPGCKLELDRFNGRWKFAWQTP